MIIELGLCFALYSLGAKIYKNIASNTLSEEDEDIIDMVKDENTNVFEQDDRMGSEEKHQAYVNSSLASMGMFAVGSLLGPLGLILYFYGAIPYAKEVKKALVEDKKINADVLFFLADLLTLFVGNFFTAAFGMYLIHSGKLATARAKDNSRKLVMHMFEELPTQVRVIDMNGHEIRTPLEGLEKGDIITVVAGEVIPVDGVITQGVASIDQQALSGESQPWEKGAGEPVLANTIVIAGAILKAAGQRKLTLLPRDDAACTIGYGIRVQTEKSLVHVGSDRFFQDQGISIPKQIKAVFKRSLQKRNICVLVGINGRVAGAIELEPRDKARIVENLQNQGRAVCFVGDGINDAMALKQADVSISLAGATTIAKDMAEIIFMDGNIASLDQLMALSLELDKNPKKSLKIYLVPSVVNVAGAFILNFNIMTALLVNVGCNLAGMANVLTPPDRLDSRPPSTEPSGNPTGSDPIPLEDGFINE
ncbi:MAG: HAD-IC family P-type ATPase [Proteobacteria bacterium]|nr:HAD-IC family P-type ATPase [Pseudomonadota bacterium]